MAVIRRVSCTASATTQIIPPDDETYEGVWQWTVINPTGSGGPVELVDASSKTVGDGLPVAAGAEWDSQSLSPEKIWAAVGSGSAIVVIVTGTAAGPV